MKFKIQDVVINNYGQKYRVVEITQAGFVFLRSLSLPQTPLLSLHWCEADSKFELSREASQNPPDYELLAVRWHDGQYRRDGVTPYIEHPKEVVSIIRKRGGNMDQIDAGWLHDVMEDCELSVMDLRKAGVRDRVIEIVEILTHRVGETYDAYIFRVMADPDATSVKIADLLDNLAGAPSTRKIGIYAESLRKLLLRERRQKNV